MYFLEHINQAWNHCLFLSFLLLLGLFQHGPDGACQKNAEEGSEAPQ